MASAASYVRHTPEQLTEAYKTLASFVEIPSVSDPESSDFNMETLNSAAKFAGGMFEKLGFKIRYESINGSAPFMIAERKSDPSQPTVLCYGHYDVVVVNRPDWKLKNEDGTERQLNPFVMQEINGRYYGRGTADDKGGLVLLASAIERLIQAGVALPNLTILTEGEEEYGSTNMSTLLAREVEVLKADVLVVMDGKNRDLDTGTLTASTGGVMSHHVKIEVMEQGAHSGCACLVPCPGVIMGKMIAAVSDPAQIPGFMDGIHSLSDGEREVLRANAESVEEYQQHQKMLPGVQLRGDPSESTYERVAKDPSITVLNGKIGPEGAKGNSIQPYAEFNLGARISAGQDPQRASEAITAHLRAQVTHGARVTITPGSVCPAWKGDMSKPYAVMYREALAAHFPKTVVDVTKGAIPFLHDLQQLAPEMELLLPGIEDPDCNAHIQNESLHKPTFERQLNTFMQFLQMTTTKV